MILRGILDLSLGNMLCIRGFARMGDLAKTSKADKSYQRDLITEHKQEVLDFLHKKEMLFFPEIILSYSVDALPFNSAQFKHNDNNLKITTKTNKYQNKQDARGRDGIQIATINLKPQHLDILEFPIFSNDDKNKIFHRIDGNHRLSAADEEIDDQDIQNLITPFCLLLLPKETEKTGIDNDRHIHGIDEPAQVLEKTIFHNINYKHIPLKKEHHYKMMIGSESIFTNSDLSANFGKEYLLAKKYLDKFNYDEFGSLKIALTNNKYTFTHDLQKLLLQKDKQKKKINQAINEALELINKIYNNHAKLSAHQHHGLLIAFVYFAIRKNKKLSEKELSAFAYWVIENFVYEITQKDAGSIIAMYEKIIEKRYKEIFISMDFSEKYQPTYKAIEGVVNTINTENSTTIKLCPVRIDQFETGYSYKLDDEIFKQIGKCGLMIADLSNKNVNVYQEVGFAMGLNRNSKEENILLLKQDSAKNESADSKVGFNLRSTKQLRFTNTESLRQLLKQELLQYYKLSTK